MEDQETLKTSTLISKLPNSVQNQINYLLANGVVASSIVVSGVLLASHELLRVEQLFVSTSTDFINDGRLKVDKNSPGDMLASSSLGEEGAEGVVTSSRLVGGKSTIRLQTMLQAVQLPTGIAHLATGLANVDRNAFSHFDLVSGFETKAKTT